MKRGKSDHLKWFPLWMDKWLWGSTRMELRVWDPQKKVWIDYRGIFIDLLSLSYKDDGYIRANEETPYPIELLAGKLGVSVPELKICIDLCMKYGKIKETSPGIYFIKNRASYDLSERHKRRYAIVEEEEPPSEPGHEETIEEEFRELWEAYPADKGDEGEALVAYKELRQTESKETIAKAFSGDGTTHGYMGYLKQKRHPKDGSKPFDQEPMFLSTWLRNDKWRRFLGFKYKAPL